MATAPDGRLMENRGLLTDDDRRFFTGEKDVENPDKTRHEKAYNIRRRIDNIAHDLQLLRDASEDDLIDYFYSETGRTERLERELEELRNQLSDE